MIVVTPDRFARLFTCMGVMPKNVRDGFHRNILCPTMTDVLRVQDDEQPHNRDRRRKAVLEVRAADPIHEGLLALLPDRPVIGVIGIDLAQYALIPGLAGGPL